MVSPRWRKLLRDVSLEKGRAAMMVAAIAVSLAAVGVVLGAYAILTREIAVNYAGTRPASATLEVAGGVGATLVDEVRRLPDIAEAEARDMVLARVRVGDDWRPMLMFVVDDFADMRLNTFRPEGGAWPPPEGTMLVERTAVSMLEAGPGQSVIVKMPHAEPRAVAIAGVVHDPGLAPAWQEREGYGYITRATLAALGEPPLLHELRIAVRDGALDARAIEATAAGLAARLGREGHEVHEIRVPPPGQHPHQRQMTTILVLMFTFAGMALILSAVLVATSLAAMLARQVREIGVMKTIGARAGQIAGLYVALVLAIGVASALVAWPLGVAGARALAGVVAGMLNFTLTSSTIPAWVLAVQAAAGLVIPLAVAAIPIGRASRVTVRAAIDQHGVSGDTVRARFSSLPAPLRNLLRRPARLALTLGLLAAGGAMFMTALNVLGGWERTVAKVYETRFYDVELRLHAPQPPAVAERLRRVPGVRVVEGWGYTPAAIARPGQIDVVRTYPDGGHGSFSVLAPPPATGLIRFPVKAGRWLEPSDGDGVVLNHAAAAQLPDAKIADTVLLSIDGRQTPWRLVGIVEEIGAAGVAYVTDDAFARVAGTGDATRMLRIATDAASPQQRTAIIQAIERELVAAHVGVEAAIPLAELRTAIGDHIVVLIRMLMAMAVVLATVGVLGLGSAMGTSVIERTREIGVMKAIGATPARVARMILAEALVIGALSWVLALAVSLPLTGLVDGVVGRLGFLAPLPIVIAPAPALGWLALVGAVGLLATLVPARRAGAVTVREALAHV